MPAGFLLLNKPKGISTFKILYPVKRAFRGYKVGHAGTLDPDAHGLVIAAVGKATRLLSFIEAENKCYEFVLHLGVETDSYDAEGEITRTWESPEVTGQQVIDAFKDFKGEISQIPPVYSAIKIDGKRACDRVRKGEEVEIKSRVVKILDLELLDNDLATLKKEFRIRCACSKGTYIRSLGNDLGKALGTGAHVSDIYRTKIGASEIAQAVDAEQQDLGEHLISPIELLPEIPVITLENSAIDKLSNGIKLTYSQLQQEYQEILPNQRYFILDERGDVQMYAETDHELLRPKVQLTDGPGV